MRPRLLSSSNFEIQIRFSVFKGPKVVGELSFFTSGPCQHVFCQAVGHRSRCCRLYLNIDQCPGIGKWCRSPSEYVIPYVAQHGLHSWWTFAQFWGITVRIYAMIASRQRLITDSHVAWNAYQVQHIIIILWMYWWPFSAISMKTSCSRPPNWWNP